MQIMDKRQKTHCKEEPKQKANKKEELVKPPSLPLPVALPSKQLL